MALCKAYEKSPDYCIYDFDAYCEQDPKILQLPKRAGKIPKEYDEIMFLAKSMPGATEEERIGKAINEMGILCNTGYILRWKLAKEKVPKPRAYDGRIVIHPQYYRELIHSPKEEYNNQ